MNGTAAKSGLCPQTNVKKTKKHPIIKIITKKKGSKLNDDLKK